MIQIEQWLLYLRYFVYYTVWDFFESIKLAWYFNETQNQSYDFQVLLHVHMPHIVCTSWWVVGDYVENVRKLAQVRNCVKFMILRDETEKISSMLNFLVSQNLFIYIIQLSHMISTSSSSYSIDQLHSIQLICYKKIEVDVSQKNFWIQ